MAISYLYLGVFPYANEYGHAQAQQFRMFGFINIHCTIGVLTQVINTDSLTSGSFEQI